METLNIVVAEILLCLALAWALGFLVAWILFRKAKNKYEEAISELEENLSYLSTSNKNKEREITILNLKIQGFEETFTNDMNRTKHNINNREDIQKNSQNTELLRLIDDNLHKVKKK